MPYADAGSQTIIAGLAKDPVPQPSTLMNAATPPAEDTLCHKHRDRSQVPTIAETEPTPETEASNPMESSPSNAQGRPPLSARISLPALDIEGPVSPPPTGAVLSPLPLMNRLHAGHTPIHPGSHSPVPLEMSSTAIPSPPSDDIALEGPLVLPTEPGDGAQDRIELRVLQQELEKIAEKQEHQSAVTTTRPPGRRMSADDDPEDFGLDPDEFGVTLTRSGSAESPGISSTGSPEIVVDGVILKKAKMNLGAPLGQV